MLAIGKNSSKSSVTLSTLLMGELSTQLQVTWTLPFPMHPGPFQRVNIAFTKYKP